MSNPGLKPLTLASPTYTYDAHRLRLTLRTLENPTDTYTSQA